MLILDDISFLVFTTLLPLEPRHGTLMLAIVFFFEMSITAEKVVFLELWMWTAIDKAWNV